MPTYSSATLVRKAAKWIPSGLSDSNLESFIVQAESVIDETMLRTARGGSPDFTFDAKRHAIIQRAATAAAAFAACSYNVASHPLLEQAEMTQNLLYYDQLRILTLLADTRVADFLAGLTTSISTVTYSSVALVRKAAKYIHTDVLDDDIKTFIFQAESIVDAVMRFTGRGTVTDFTFSADKHGLIQRATTSIAAFYAVTYDVGSHPLLEQAEMTQNLLYYDQSRNLELLANVRLADHLISL